jgi:hypothetical protein
MSENKASHVQHAQDAWKKMIDDGVARWELMLGEVAKYEGQGVGQAKTAVEEMAKLQMDTLGYFGQLSSEWRKLSIDATRKATEIFTPKA